MGSWFFPRLGATALFICTIGSWANPALSQQTLHVQTTVTDIASRGFTFGPVNATCDPGGFGPPFVTRESTIITGGTGAFAGIRGSGLETSAGYKDGSEIAQQEQVWVLPPSSQR